MASAETGDPETVLADLELTRGLTIQMTALGTLGLLVAATALGGLYQAVTGDAAAFRFAPGVLGVGGVVGIAYAFVRSYRRARSPVGERASEE